MLDLIVVSMPVIDPVVPTPGIYYIKGSAEQAGFTAIAKDINVWFHTQVDSDTGFFEDRIKRRQ